MEIQKVNAMVKVREDVSHEDFKLQVYRTGPDAIPVTDIPVLMAMNGPDSISMVEVVSAYETTKAEEYARLKRTFKAEALALIYPSPNVPLPRTVDDLDLEPHQIVSRTLPQEAPVDEKVALRARLEELGQPVGFGNYGVAKLRELVAEAEKALAA